MQETHDTSVQILEVRAGDGKRAVTITAAISADAGRAILKALSEELDRRRARPTASVDDVLQLREQTAVLERFEPLAAADAHAIIQLTDAELRVCLLALTDYVGRVDGEHYQPLDLRERLQVIARITRTLWDANATAAAAAAGEPLQGVH